jgi:hypothetical protein
MLPQSDGKKRLDTQCKAVRTVDETIIIGIAISRLVLNPKKPTPVGYGANSYAEDAHPAGGVLDEEDV